MVVIRSPPRTRKRSKQIREITEAVQDATEHPEEPQNVMEQPLQKNIQDIDQTGQTTQKDNQGDTQPTLKHMEKHFFKSYEIEMAQVLGNLGTSTDRDDTTQEEFIFEERNPLE
jgi:hypothetical protein